MKITGIEIETSFGGVISEAPYENVKPAYRDKLFIDIEDCDDEIEIRKRYRGMLHDEQRMAFELLRGQLKAELVQLQFENVIIREKNGKQYPSVTSIISWMKDWHISKDDLIQYAARGTIVHKLIEYYIHNQIWLMLEDLSEKDQEMDVEITTMLQGGKKLLIEDCSFQKFFEVHGKDFEISETEVTVYNEEHKYSGRMDAEGLYKGIKSIIDYKTGKSWDFKQLAAYAECREDIKQLVVCPVGPTDNKTGVMKPVVCENVKSEFKKFLRDRVEFKKRFGI